MSEKTIHVKLKPRHDTANNWSSRNPILAEGELGIKTPAGKIKIGDGVTTWNSLPYLTDNNYTTAEKDKLTSTTDRARHKD